MDTAYNDGTSKYLYLNPISLKRLVASGTQLKRFNKEIVQAGFKAAQEVYAEHSAKDPSSRRSSTTCAPSSATRSCGTASPSWCSRRTWPLSRFEYNP
jgi:TRAP-type mannitol/chloroaromatic compound transport system substrate-binding protein